MKKLCFLLLLMLFMLACNSADDNHSTPIQPVPTPTAYTVKYEVSCNTPGFSGAYSTLDNNIVSYSSPGNSWSYSYSGAYTGDIAIINAQACNENSTITVKIYQNSTILAQESGTGDYVIVQVSGTLK